MHGSLIVHVGPEQVHARSELSLDARITGMSECTCQGKMVLLYKLYTYIPRPTATGMSVIPMTVMHVYSYIYTPLTGYSVKSLQCCCLQWTVAGAGSLSLPALSPAGRS